MRTLSASDLVFLMLERVKQPMHVAGLCTFELPADAPDDFVRALIEAQAGSSLPEFPFDQVLHRGVFWRRADSFNLAQHCHYHVLTTGSDDEMMALVSDLHARPLDRSRPLWSLHLIDNLRPESDGAPLRFGLYLKMHHAMADGIAAMRLFQRALASDPVTVSGLPMWAKRNKKERRKASRSQPSFSAIMKSQLASIMPVCRELKDDLSHTLTHRRHPEMVQERMGGLDAPASLLNQRISDSRYLSVKVFNKSRFVAIAEHFNASTNDAVLAVCSHALRHYLLAQNALPDEPLVAFVPLSLRRNDSAYGNQIAFIPTNLGTHLSDLGARVQLIHDSVNLGKLRYTKLDSAAAVNYMLMTYGWAGINLAARIYPAKQAFNLIISNLPADDTPLYLNGARLSSLSPFSVLFDGQALNITFSNYQDRIDFGITACQTALPNIQMLPDLLAEALAAYEALISG